MSWVRAQCSFVVHYSNPLLNNEFINNATDPVVMTAEIFHDLKFETKTIRIYGNVWFQIYPHY